MPAPNAINPRTGKRYGWEAAQAAKVKADDTADIKKQLALLKRQKKAVEARDDLLTFTQFTMPDPEDPNDVERSRYAAAPFHRAIAKHLEELERGDFRQLILTMPPRAGKTELATKRFVAWFMGRSPYENVAVATYSDTMAEDYGADIRSIMASPQYKQVFPSFGLARGGAAKSNIQTTKGGRAVFVGVGGALTGRGASCFVAGTLVETSNGVVPIEAIRPGDEVLSYDAAEGLVYRPVEAVARRKGLGIFRIATAAGRVVEATGDHPFYVDGRWVEARSLTEGDRLLCTVRDDASQARRRDSEALSSRARRFLLLGGMLERFAERIAVRASSLRALRQRFAEGARQFWVAATRPHILFGWLQGPGTAGRTGTAGFGSHEALRQMQRHVSAGEQRHSILRTLLRFASARSENAVGGESALEGWCERQSVKAACDAAFQRSAAARHETGRRAVRLVPNAEEIACAPHRRECAEQSRFEPHNALLEVSQASAQSRRESDFVASVESDSREADVYDIQVGGTHCFFAGEILVHNCLIIDDPTKNAEDARSDVIRNQTWEWFTKVAMTRRMSKKLVVIIMTRWHSDDIVGRLTDPENPNYSAEEAKGWKIITIPAIAEEDDVLGRKPGEALWPERYDLDFLKQQQRLDPLGFAALYQQRPTVADGVLFRRENIQFYKQADLPEDLRIYCSSDHAVGTKQRNDYTVMFKVGIDRQSNIWVLDCFRAKVAADKAVETMLAMASGKQKPLLWWAERGHISKSIGPFLRKRMLETGTYINMVEVTPVADKEQRAQSIAARVAMGKVYFPVDKLWTEKVVNEMLAFPNGTNDDAVDALAYIGLGLQNQFGPSKHSIAAKQRAEQPATLTLDWVKLSARHEAEKRAQRRLGGC